MEDFSEIIEQVREKIENCLRKILIFSEEIETF